METLEYPQPASLPTARRGRGCLMVIGGRPDTVRKAAGLGLDVILLQHRDHFVPETAQLAKAVIVADYTNWPTVEPLVLAAHQAYGFTAAISLTEPGLEPVGRVNDLFGFDGHSFAVSHLFKNKLAMRRHLAAHSAEAAALSVAAAEATGEDSLRAFGAEHGYPFVVKPVDLTASVGVHKVERADQIPAVWAEVEALQARRDLLWGNFFEVGAHLVEEYLEGPELSVETFTFDRRHVVVAVTEKLVADKGFIELGHAQPARITAATREAVVDCTMTFLDAIGLRQGAAHTEIKLTGAGPKVVEGHNRIGGDRIVDLLELVFGVDLETLMIAWPMKLIDPLPDEPLPRQAAATRFLTAPPGTIAEIQGADEARADPRVFALDLAVSAGRTVKAGSNWDRCGQIIATGVDTDEAVHCCQVLLDKITIRMTDAGDEPTNDPVSRP